MAHRVDWRRDSDCSQAVERRVVSTFDLRHSKLHMLVFHRHVGVVHFLQSVDAMAEQSSE